MRRVGAFASVHSIGLVGLLAFLAGPASAKGPPRPSPDVAALPVDVDLGSVSGFSNSPGLLNELNNSLFEHGYRVVQGRTGAALVVEASVVTVQNSLPFVGLITEVQVSANLISSVDSQVMARAFEKFNSNNGDVNRKAIDKLIQSLMTGTNLDAYAQDLKRREQERIRSEAARRAEERRTEVARQREEQARRAEESARAERADENDWSQSHSEECRSPKSLTACDAVRGYLSEHASGKHATEAAQYLKEAEPRLAVLQDENDWQEAIGKGQLAGCRRPERSDGCASLEKYLTDHASGAHASEAQRTIKASASKVAVLRKQEEAREQAQESIGQLCEVVQQLAQLVEAERLQRRVDAASGTVNLYQKRQNATARILLSDKRQKLMKEIGQVGVKFNEKRDCPEPEAAEEEQ